MVAMSEDDMEQLHKLMRRASVPHLRTKATALWNVGKGRTTSEVAEFLGVSRTSVSNWISRFRNEGIAGLAIRPGRGRRPKADVAEVEQYLRQSPRAFGLTQTRWTLSALAQAVPSLQGFSDTGVWKVLNRMGYRYKRGQPYLQSPDPDYDEKRGLWTRPSERLPRIQPE